MTDTDRLDALAAAAKRGPWVSTRRLLFGLWIGRAYSADSTDEVLWRAAWPAEERGTIITSSEADAAFIVALVNAYRAGELVPVRERDELRAALDEAYPTTSRELFHGHHPMCGWTIEADPKACNCVVALHREDGAS